MARVSVANLTRKHIVDADFVKRAAAATLLYEKELADVSLGLVFVGVKKIVSLNLKYNAKNAPTDVLTFAQSQAFPSGKGEDKFLGEIFLCPEVIKKNASKLNTSFKKELAHVIIHSVLHLLGYDHEGDEKKYLKMHKLEEKIMETRLGL